MLTQGQEIPNVGKPEVLVDEQGRVYVWTTKTVHGQEVKVKIYADRTKRVEQTIR